MPILSLAGLLTDQIIFEGGVVDLDGIIDVSPSNTRTVTMHPVEDGSTVSDAIHQNPVQVSFSAWITDTAQSIIDARTYLNLANVTGLQLVESHTKKQLQKLEQAANTGKLVTIKTKYAKYEDYYLLAFDYTETSTKGILINFSIMERQVSTDEDRSTAFFSPDIGLWS